MCIWLFRPTRGGGDCIFQCRSDVYSLSLTGLTSRRSYTTHPFEGCTQGGHRVLAPNGCMVVHNIIVSGEAILSSENSGNLWAVGASTRTPLAKLTAFPTPLAGGKGIVLVLEHSRQTPRCWDVTPTSSAADYGRRLLEQLREGAASAMSLSRLFHSGLCVGRKNFL